MNLQNKHIYRYHTEIEQMQGSILYHFHRGKINEFYKQNGIRIESLIEKIRKLQEEYFVIENDNIKVEGEEKKPVMKEGKTQEEFTQRYNDLMNMEVSIIL